MPSNASSNKQLGGRPQATQILTASDKIQRRAQCIDHAKWSSNYQGADIHGWLFRCGEGHLFYAIPDHYAPVTQEGIQRWKEMQLQNRLNRLNQKHQ